MSLVFLVTSCGGFALRLYQDRNRAVSQLGMHRRQEMIAGKLHDVVCNDLAYALRQIDTLETVQEHPADTGNRTDSLVDIRQSITEALRYTRTAITTLQAADAESRETRIAGSMDLTGSNADKTAIDIAALLNQGQKKLDHIGINGIIAAPNLGTVTMPSAMATLVEGLIREIFGNLLKYADPTKGYVLTARSDGITLHIGVSDSPRPDCQQSILPNISPVSSDAPSTLPTESSTDMMSVSSNPPLHGGTGIRSYQTRLAALGGELSTSASDDQWTLEAAIPLMDTDHTDGHHSAGRMRIRLD